MRQTFLTSASSPWQKGLIVNRESRVRIGVSPDHPTTNRADRSAPGPRNAAHAPSSRSGAIAVAERVLPSWARAARLTCVRTAGDSLEPADGALVVVDKDRRVAVDEQLFVVRIGFAWGSRPRRPCSRPPGSRLWCPGRPARLAVARRRRGNATRRPSCQDAHARSRLRTSNALHDLLALPPDLVLLRPALLDGHSDHRCGLRSRR